MEDTSGEHRLCQPSCSRTIHLDWWRWRTYLSRLQAAQERGDAYGADLNTASDSNPNPGARAPTISLTGELYGPSISITPDQLG